MERDPFDLFLDKIAREVNLPKEDPQSGNWDIAEATCHSCYEPVPPGSRHCPACGAFQSIPDSVFGSFKPRTIMKRKLSVTLLGIESGVEIMGRMFTRVHLKIRNLSPVRVHISLTYVDSVLIDITGRQHSPIDAEEFMDDSVDSMYPTWFYIYPEAFRQGVLLFRECDTPIQKVIVCGMHQENEDEIFTFNIDGYPGMSE